MSYGSCKVLCGSKIPIIVLGGGETMIFFIFPSWVIMEDNVELGLKVVLAVSCYVKKCYPNTKFNINTVYIDFDLYIILLIFSIQTPHTS